MSESDSIFGPASVEVQPQALETFSKKIVELGSTFTSSVSSDVSSNLMSAEFGAAPVPSAILALRVYGRASMQFGKFTSDIGAANAAFYMGSLTIAANYVISDDASEDEMADVDAAFNTANVPTDQTVVGQQNAHEEATQQTIDSIDPVDLPEPDYTAPGADQCVAPNSDQPADTEAESAAADASSYYGEDSVMGDVRPSADAPVSVQIEQSGATDEDMYIQVVNSDGDVDYIPNPIYDPSTAPDYYNY